MEEKSGSRSTSIKVDSGAGMFWFMGWLFTIAFAQLDLFHSLLGLIAWPYYLGIALR